MKKGTRNNLILWSTISFVILLFMLPVVRMIMPALSEQALMEKIYNQYGKPNPHQKEKEQSNPNTDEQSVPDFNPLQFKIVSIKGHEADSEYHVEALAVVQLKITNTDNRSIKNCKVICIAYDSNKDEIGFNDRCIVWSDEPSIKPGGYKYKEFPFFQVSPKSIHSVGLQIESISY